MFAVDPDGNLLWSTGLDHPAIDLRGPSFTDIVFDTDRMYITVYRRPSRPPTIRTYDYGGDLLWYSGDLGPAVGGPPALHPSDKLIVNWAQTGIQALGRDGEVQWIRDHPVDGQLMLAPQIGPDDTILVADWSGPDFWALDDNGNTQWLGPQPGYDLMSGIAVSPDNQQIVASGADTFGRSGWVRGYLNGLGEFQWQVDLRDENGLIQLPGSAGVFSPDSRVHSFATYLAGDATYGFVHAVDTSATGVPLGETFVVTQAETVPMEILVDGADFLVLYSAGAGGPQGSTSALMQRVDPDGGLVGEPTTLFTGPRWEHYGSRSFAAGPDGGALMTFSFWTDDPYNGARARGLLFDLGPGCPADFNDDGELNTLDVLSFLNAWSAGDPRADFNGDGNVNTLDVLAFLNAWGAGC